MAEMGAVSVRPDGWGSHKRTEVTAAYLCDACDRLVLAHLVTPNDVASRDAYQSIEGLPDVPGDAVVKWLPCKGVSQKFPDVPEHIASAASEAYECRSIGAYRASMSLARAVLEATAKDKGYVDRTLNMKIDRMRTDGLIREHIKEAAHEIRHLGNDMAHGDFVDPVSAEEAELSLTLIGEVLAEVYQSPARVARAKEARKAKWSGP